MTQNNGDGNTSASLIEEAVPERVIGLPKAPQQSSVGELPTRTKLRARRIIRQNRVVIMAAGAVVFALLIFAIVSAPSGRKTQKPSLTTTSAQDENVAPVEKSTLPIIDSGRSFPGFDHNGVIGEQDVARTATRKTLAPAAPTEVGLGSLASIPPFGDRPWQAPPYQPAVATTVTLRPQEQQRNERNTLEKSSIVFVRNGTDSEGQSRREEAASVFVPVGLGLPVGTRLRARLESSATTALRTPVLAVIEYNYERDGRIVVPAGSKVVGQIQEADRSGYMRIQFDSLLLPDGANVPIQAGATDLEMHPIKGKVEGKNTGKNILVRSLSGIGEASALLVGRGSLNEPLSESDLIRERVSNNVGQASDEEISGLSITSRVVVTIGAGAEVYVVLEQSSKPVPDINATTVGKMQQDAHGVDQLRQLLQLQQELNQNGAKTQ
ncbi:MAG TPA: TrbI/VirB10 family protein [Terriglobales bacterium]|nr:TrbI/VirB10 family protein [Terriglobales bacterium]